MYGYIYITTNLLNGKKYIGQHKASNKHWYNNGIICVSAYTCSDGFVSGRLKKNG